MCGKVIHSIPRWTGHLRRKVNSDTIYVGFKICTENFTHVVSTCVNIFVVPGAQNLYSARGTGHLRCQGHKLIVVPHLWCWILSGQTSLLSFCHNPILHQSLGIITLIILSSQLKCDHLNYK